MMDTFTIIDENLIELLISSPSLTIIANSGNHLSADIVVDRATSGSGGSSSGLIVPKYASEQIFKTDIVAMSGSTTVKVAHNNTNFDDSFALGMALNDASIGDPVNVMIMGQYSDLSFSAFPLNSTIFLDTDGGMTDVKPTRPLSGSVTILGRSFGNGDIYINVTRPIII